MPVGVCGRFIVEPLIESNLVSFQHVPISRMHSASYESAASIADHIIPNVDVAEGLRQQDPSQYLLNAAEECDQVPVAADDVVDHSSAPAEGSANDRGTEESAEEGEAIPFPLVHNVSSTATVTQLSMEQHNGLVEVTIGLYGPVGEMVAMTPSMILKQGGILSFAESCASGHGACLTPPPADIVPAASLQVRERQ